MDIEYKEGDIVEVRGCATPMILSWKETMFPTGRYWMCVSTTCDTCFDVYSEDEMTWLR